jgi:hypothetical protein
MNERQYVAAGLYPPLLATLAGAVLDGYQEAAIMEATRPACRALWCWARQAGKTYAAALVAYHAMLYSPGALVLHVGPRLAQGKLLHREVLRLHQALHSPVAISAQNVESLTLANGSALQLVPASQGGRGHSAVTLLIADELAHMENAAEVMEALSPTLAVSRGRLIGMSTFNGETTANYFYQQWTEGEGYARSLVPASMCPRLTPDFLAAERRTMTADAYAQEYDCIPRPVTGALFPHDLVMSLLADRPEPEIESSASVLHLPEPKARPAVRVMSYTPAGGFIRSEI